MARNTQTEGRQLFAGDMWVVMNFADPNDRYQSFLQRGKPAIAHLTEGIILYSKVIIPTQDFLSLTALVGVLGERAAIDLLEDEAIEFRRLRGSFAYFGDGKGFQSFEIERAAQSTKPSFCAPIDEAVHWALSGLNDKPKDPRLPKLVIAATHEFDASTIAPDVLKETNADVSASIDLKALFEKPPTDLNRIQGIMPDQVRIYGGPGQTIENDDIDIILALAAANVELRMALEAGCDDMATVCPMGHMLKAKASRTLGQAASEGFTQLREIAGVPDVTEGILAKSMSLDQLLRLRRTKNGEQFRDWFHENCRGNTVETAREYVTLLNEVPKVQSLPLKALRLLVTTAVGMVPLLPVVSQIAGAVAGAADSFFIDRWLRGASPKYFVDDLKKLSRARTSP